MEVPRLDSSVRSVTILQKDADGALRPVVVYKRSGKKKKTTKALRPVERLARQLVDAQARAADSYRARHDKSNEKKRDGWLRDFPVNVFRASERGNRAIKLNRLLSF